MAAGIDITIESDKFFEDIYNHIFDGIALVNASAHKFVNCNDAFCRLLGCGKSEIIGAGIFAIHPAEARPEMERQFEALREETADLAKDIPIRTKDGRLVYADIATVKVSYRDKPHLLATFRDVTERKEAEAALRQSENLLSRVFEAAPIGICVIRDDHYAMVNDYYCRLCGYGEKELIGREARMLFATDCDFERAQIDTAALLDRNETISFEWRLKRKDGASVPILVSGKRLIRGAAAADFVFTLTDLTEIKKAEAALRESEANLNEIQHMVQLGNWNWDLRTGKVEWSPEVYKIFQLDPASFDPTIDSILALSPWPEEQSRDKELIRRAGESRETGGYEQRFLRPDKSVGYYQSTFQGKYGADGGLERIVGTVLDITDRKRSETALRESEEKYRTLVERMQDAVFRCDPEGAVIFASPSAARLFGRPSADSLIGLHIERDLGLSCADGRGLIEALGETGKLTQREVTIRLPAGGAVSALLSGQLYADGDGKALGFDGVCSDITARKRMEAEKERLEEMLLHSQKMESIGRLAGGIAHDFNNLLTVIIGNADMAMEMIDPEGRPYSLLAQAIKAAEGAANLTKQLLAFSRKQVIEPKAVDLNEIVVGMRKMISPLIGENVELEIASGAGLDAVRADQGQIEQVIMNLAVNAKDAMPSGGKLSIATSNALLDEDYCRGRPDAVPGRHVLLSISDTGTGMDEEVMSHLFEPFFTTKAKGRGTGLGLATVYGIVRQSGGHVQVRSEPGKGTAFMLYLPSTQDAPESVIARGPSGDAPGGTETILVAEDNPQVLEFSRSSLAKLGYTVMTALTGEEAVALSRAYDGPIDLFVTDIILPGMNGKETASKISEDRPRMKVLFNSGYTAEVIDRQGVLDEGVNFIPKPFTSRNLGLKVREVLDRP